jgi:hypothetical protein
MKLLITFAAIFFIFAISPVFSHEEWEANDANVYRWDPNPDRMFSLQFANKIGDKDALTFGEVVTFFLLTVHGHFLTFEEDMAFLVRHKIAHDIKLNENDTVNMGTVALMTARTLNLKNSLMYNIFGSKRYAVRVCIAAGMLSHNAGEFDKVSGEELIEIMRKMEQGYTGFRR